MGWKDHTVVHCDPELSAPQALFSTMHSCQIVSSRAGSTDYGLAYVLSRSTIQDLILATQDGLRGSLLHCQGKGDDEKDGIGERDVH